MANKKQYDYIIAGAGCAGLSLLMHMINSGRFNDKRVLITDKERKSRNDRTWCFWERKGGLFESLVFHRWQQAWFHTTSNSRLLSLAPYEYKLIRGIDFYEYCFNTISRHSNIEICYGEISSVESRTDVASISIGDKNFTADYVFNSIMSKPLPVTAGAINFLQHFRGWVVETTSPAFDPSTATLMDFRVDQKHGTTFVYAMPFSATRALVEYTIFSPSILQTEEYEKGLKTYLHDILGLREWRIVEEESGVIPMSNHRFPVHNGRVINIGTAGGQTKASSGYTFRFIQKHSEAIVNRLIAGQSPIVAEHPGRFRFYDNTLLRVLHDRRVEGVEIFNRLFSKNETSKVLRFLDNESTIGEELGIIASLPVGPFLRAGLSEW